MIYQILSCQEFNPTKEKADAVDEVIHKLIEVWCVVMLLRIYDGLPTISII